MRRKSAIARHYGECQGKVKGRNCYFVAWTPALEAELDLRERDEDPVNPLLLCSDCQARFDNRGGGRTRPGASK
jgi:hypothetical protein